jgi:type IV pilus assembly protein PilQ
VAESVRSRQRRSRSLALVLAAGLCAAAASAPAEAQQAAEQQLGAVDLRLVRQADGVEVVIEGTGSSPQLRQTTRGSTWLGELTAPGARGLRRGPVRLALPEAGLQSVSLEGSGGLYRLMITPVPGYPLGRPVVSADGRSLILSFAASPQPNLQTFEPNRRLPSRVPQPDVVPPLQPRAVAPPLGDMAVGSMVLRNPSVLNVSGPPVTMTLKNAPIRDVLMALSSLGRYGFTFVEDYGRQENREAGTRRVSLSFVNESYGRAFNSALMAAGLQGRVEGSTIFAGPNVLNKSLGSQLSKVYRLNQVSANSAADYLANLGASVTKTNVITTAVTQGVAEANAVANAPNSSTTQASSQTTVESYGASTGPLLGLLATTDSRLSTITLVGSPNLVAIAEQYLKQLDLRQRQVALSVKILDVTLQNDRTVDNSFAFRYGNNFIVNDSGQLLGAFGSVLPPTETAFGREQRADSDPAVEYTPPEGTTPGQITVSPDGNTGFNVIGGAGIGTTTPNPQLSAFYALTKQNPGINYPKDNFYNFVKAMIESRTTKVLASPTLILSENSEELRKGDDLSPVNIQSLATGSSGTTSSSSTNNQATIGRTRANESYVTVGEQVITNYKVTTGTQGNGNACQPEFGIAGMTFGARVSKIDDNGFVTFSLSPAITATVRQEAVPGCGPIDILAVRRLDTGSARVRDGQTLILTGVISDSDSETVRKWPILGDIPIVGQFFRSSGSNRDKRELVIMVTPRIINDGEGGAYGYGYAPSTRQARELMGGSR